MRLVALAALILSSAAITRSADAEEPPPTIASDKADYFPGSTVTLTGTGWGGDAGVHLSVNDTLGKTWNREVDVAVAADGSITDVFELPTTFVAQYDVVATGLSTGRTATTTFTDASADLDQCANGALLAPESCNNAFPGNWVNGNLGASKSHYAEGDSVPYRIKMDGLPVGSTGNTLVFAWDVTKDSKHALDYLTSYNRTVGDANPCTGVSGCTLGSETTFPIPQDPSVPFGQIAGSFSMFGGTITGLSAYGANPGADSCPAGTPDFVGSDTRCITVIFTATTSNPVLAWGGHIATRANWGAGNAAVNISGSPFHTSFVALNGSGGNQDRSLSNDAVIFPATITIIKHAEPAGATQFPFTASPAPLANFSLTDNSGATDPSQSFTLDAPAEFTTYTIDEGVVPNFATTAIVCQVTDANGGSATTNVPNGSVQINIQEGENRTCTFTNTLQTGTLTVVKHVVNDDGGDADADDWSIHVKDNGTEVTGSPQAGSETGTQYTLVAGTYDVSETGGPGGYSFDGFSGDCSAAGSVTLVAGQNKTCTLTNDDDVATLKLVKVVTNDDGGNAVANDFTLFADADAPDDGRNFSNLGGQGDFEPVFAGAGYELSESGPAGYTGGNWICDGGNLVGSTITLDLGDDVTCTLTNTDNRPQLKLVKVVTNDDGGTAGEDDFTLSATGSSRSFNSATDDPQFHDVTAGVTYTLSETGPDGYSASSWSCTGTGGNQVGNTISVALGGSVTCTITNNDIAPRLKLVKNVVNDDGGTAGPADFTLSASGTSDSFNSKTASPVFHDVTAGVTYTLSEDNLAGYAAGAWDCTGTGAQVGDEVALGLDEELTCTITNDDIAPRLKLVKSVTNDDGGTAGAQDFDLSATGTSDSFSSKTASPVFHDVTAGVTYTLSEANLPGYAAGVWDCTGTGAQVGDEVTLDLGEELTCTITNDDIAPRLKLVKDVVTDDGGDAGPEDFKLSATGASRSFDSQTATPAFHDVTAGVSYALTEVNLDGYSASQWDCVGDGTQLGAMITLGLGDEATCTITNDDETPTLTLVKDVVNDDGGDKEASEWTLSATAAPDDHGRNFSGPGDSGAAHDVFAGVAYDLSEAPSPGVGYSSTGQWSCPGGTMSNGNTTVTVPLGADVTCTIINNDVAPQLKLVKEVVNNDGGAAGAGDFELSATGSSRSFSSKTAVPVFHDVTAGVVYTLSEAGPLGYTGGSWSCVGGATPVGDTIELEVGEQVTCTITNADNTPQLKLVKDVVNNDGGAANAGDFELSATGSSRSFSSKTASPVFHDVTAGVVYTLSEDAVDGYTGGAWSCDGGTQVNNTIAVGLGAQVTCTIINTDDTPQLKLVKDVVKNDGGTAGAEDFKLSATGSSRSFSSQTALPAFHDVTAGVTYNLSEDGLDGYTPGSWVCTGGGSQNGSQITLALGEQVTCTITNTDDTPQLKLVKVVVKDDGGTAIADDWTLSASAMGDASRNISTPGGSGGFEDVFAGTTYVLAETGGPAGYSASQWNCVGGGTQLGAMITLGLGDQVTCTITNDDDTPSLTLVKNVVNNDGGTKLAQDWTLSAQGDPNGDRDFSGPGDSGTAHDVFAGVAYDLSEDPDPGAGYSSTGEWSCPGGTMSNNNTTVTVDLGEDVTCTITNTDDTPRLKLVKVVSGGAASAAEFNLSATAAGNPLGRNFSSKTASPAFHDVAAGATYALSETGPAGYTASSWSCTGGGVQAGSQITLALGEQVTCTITNTRDLGSISAIKYHDLDGDGTHENGGDPTLSGWTMFVDLDKNGVFNAGEPTGTTNGGGVVTFTGLETNVGGSTYWVCEVSQAGWVNSDPGGGSVSNAAPCKTATVAKDATTTVRFGNYQRVGVEVDKTVAGGAVPNGVTFQFSIRENASTDPGGVNGGFGTVVATGSMTGPDNTITSGEWVAAGGQQYPLDPGTYQLCEAIVANYTPSWVQGVYGVDWFSPGIQSGAGFQESENTLVCITFTVLSGDGGGNLVLEFPVDNAPRGMSRTIGFWKNWTSCDGNGNQFPMLDTVLNGGSFKGVTYPGADDSNGNGLKDIRIGDLYIEGPNACKIAVDLLDKRPVGDPAKLADKAKAAGDPVYNSVSQLVAFELNQLLNPLYSGSADCQAKAADAAQLMQRFLMYIDFQMSGKNSVYALPSNKTAAKDLQANLLFLANIVDDYNNNTIAGCANPLLLPKPTVAGTNPLKLWTAVLPPAQDT